MMPAFIFRFPEGIDLRDCESPRLSPSDRVCVRKKTACHTKEDCDKCAHL